MKTIKVMNSIEATIHNKKKFNPYQTGHGVWKSKKHPNRCSRKNELRKEIAKW